MVDSNLKSKIMELSEKCSSEEIPSQSAEELLALLEPVPYNEWDLDVVLTYVGALTMADKFLDLMSNGQERYIEHAYDIMISVREEGENDYDWNCGMANICFNVQCYEEAVHYQKQAIKLAGKNPEVNTDELYELAIEKLHNGEEEISDEEMLSLYAHYI